MRPGDARRARSIFFTRPLSSRARFSIDPTDLERFPFVRTDRSGQAVFKWNAWVPRTGSGQTGPIVRVGPMSSASSSPQCTQSRNAAARIAHENKCITIGNMFAGDNNLGEKLKRRSRHTKVRAKNI